MNIKYIELAARIAEDIQPVSKARIAAVIVIKHEVISIGMCQYKTHTFQSKFKHHEAANYWHAETNAIFNALKRVRPADLEKATLYVARVKKDGTYGLAKPCSGCQHAISHFRIPEVYYTTNGVEINHLINN